MSKINAKFSSYDELFGLSEETSGTTEIKLADLETFRNHPFVVSMDEQMVKLMESIRRNGVVTPIIVRKLPNDKYEVISGHRRVFASRHLGLSSIPAIVKLFGDDDATLAMLDCNIQRAKALPSEKARAIKMKATIVKKRMAKGDGKVADIIGKENQMSGREVQRYLNLAELIPELLMYVDLNKINVIVGSELASLSVANQRCVAKLVEVGCKVSKTQAEKLKQLEKSGTLDQKAIEAVLKEEQRGKSVYSDKIHMYFNADATDAEIETKLLELLRKDSVQEAKEC